VSNWRLFPPKKPPRLPEPGERWAGFARPATYVTLGVVGALVVGVVIAVNTVSTGAPTTLEGVTAEVMTEVDAVTATVTDAAPTATADPTADPAEASAPEVSESSIGDVGVSDVTSVEPCPDGSDAEQFTITRTLTAPAGFDPRTWAEELRATYEAKDWYVNTQPFGSNQGLSIQLTGKNLIPIAITVPPPPETTPSRPAPTDTAVQITLTSSSRCTDPS